MALRHTRCPSIHALLFSAAAAFGAACVAPTDEHVGTSADAFFPAIFGSFISGSWEIFKEFGGAPSPGERLAKRMDVLQASLDEANARLGKVERELAGLLSTTVRDQNERRLRELASRNSELIMIKNLLAALANKRGDPGDMDWTAAGKTEALAAELIDPLNRSLWEWTNDDGSTRFRHTAAYPIYVAALTARVAYLQACVDPRKIHSEHGAELKRHAEFLRRTLAERVYRSVSCTSSDPIPSGARCDYDVTCRETIEGNRSTDRVRDFTCDWDGRELAKGTPFVRAADALGHSHMDRLAGKLDRLADYGWLGEPTIGTFVEVPYIGALYSGATDTPVSAPENAGNGARPTISSVAFPGEPATPSESTAKWIIGVDGTIRHLPTGRCLEVLGWSKASGAPVTLWDCHRGANQRWMRSGPGALINVHSGKCLEVEPGRSGTGRVITNRFEGHLRQADCTGRANQRWSNTRPSLRPEIH